MWGGGGGYREITCLIDEVGGAKLWAHFEPRFGNTHPSIENDHPERSHLHLLIIYITTLCNMFATMKSVHNLPITIFTSTL